MLGASLILTSMQAMVKMLPHIPAVEVVFFRTAISFAICLWMLRGQGSAMFGHPSNRKALAFRGFFGTLGLLTTFWTIQHLPLATALLLHYLNPIFTALFTYLFLGERLRKGQWWWFLLCLAGVVVVKGFDPRVSLWPFAVGVGSALFSAAAYTSIRRLTGENPVVVVFYAPLTALPITALLSSLDWVMPTWTDAAWLLAIGVFTQAGQVLMTKAYQHERAAIVASVNYMGIFYGGIIGAVFFHEHFSLVVLGGMLLVLLGILGNIWMGSRGK